MHHKMTNPNLENEPNNTAQSSKPDHTFAGELLDAEVLLRFAIRENRNIKLDDLKNLQTQIDSLRKCYASSDAESFRASYQVLVKAVYPVTAQSLRVTEKLQAGWFSVRGGHAVATILVFLIILGLQILWGIGSSFKTNLDKLETDFRDKTLEVQKQKFVVKELEIDLDKLTKEEKPVASVLEKLQRDIAASMNKLEELRFCRKV